MDDLEKIKALKYIECDYYRTLSLQTQQMDKILELQMKVEILESQVNVLFKHVHCKFQPADGWQENMLEKLKQSFSEMAKSG